ncbi:5-methyltetrahydrofolate:corrinoid iron-sulfur protein methyltransferase [Lachnospiraceae bacterium TWA4]|nr:5-methyltetrahydrofolate:corrinoid iron-sulfur protein methyltransferase [Lachnospiraceae bacterium TWA4]
MSRFTIIGERIHCISPVIRKAMEEMNPEPILARAKEQIDAGATYIDVNIGPAESNGPELMKWAVQLIQSNFDNVALALDTANMKAIEAGIAVYNDVKGKALVNSADAGDRLKYVDLAAANGAACICLCSKGAVPGSTDEIMGFCAEIAEHGLMLGMEPQDMWMDPLFLVAKGMQDKQKQILDAIRGFTELGFPSTGGLSNVSNGMPKDLRHIMDAAMLGMCMANGFTSAIVNPCDQRLMETVKSCDILLDNYMYADSYLEL